MKKTLCELLEHFYQLSLTSRLFIGFIFSVIFGLCWFYVSMFIGSFVWDVPFFDFIDVVLLASKQLESRSLIHFLLVTQSISMFFIPAIVMTKILKSNIISLWKLNTLPSGFFLFLIIQIILVNIPGMNFWSGINTSIVQLFVPTSSVLHTMYEQSQAITNYMIHAPRFVDLLINVFCIAIIPAVSEELFFRGMLQRYAARAMGRVEVAIIITSIIFSLLHADVYNFIPRFCMGIIFGYLYWYTNNLWVPIIAHFIHNSGVVITYYAIQHGFIHDNFEFIGMWGYGAVFGIVSILVVSMFLTYMVSIKMQINLSDKEQLQ
ncbi:MAG: CAAX amino terminal protease self- immunity [Bacteroidetes bacterium ADurb.Bin217]|nr:MAG: CAAX amino terminal protease self- immunity [Bacteroidetes bacterium ADurb.Bin217]